jgi:hypothetical protein
MLLDRSVLAYTEYAVGIKREIVIYVTAPQHRLSFGSKTISSESRFGNSMFQDRVNGWLTPAVLRQQRTTLFRQ